VEKVTKPPFRRDVSFLLRISARNLIVSPIRMEARNFQSISVSASAAPSRRPVRQARPLATDNPIRPWAIRLP